MKEKTLKYNINDTFYMLEDEPNIVLMKAGLQQPIYKCKVKNIEKTRGHKKAPYIFVNNYKFGWTNEEHMYQTLTEAKKVYWKRLEQEYKKQCSMIFDEMCFMFNFEPPDYIPPTKTRSKK